MNEPNYVYCDFVTGVKCRLIKLYTNTNDWRHDKTEAKTIKPLIKQENVRIQSVGHHGFHFLTLPPGVKSG
jgi:hypothetical protein